MHMRLADAAEPGETVFPIWPLGRDEVDVLTLIQNRSFAGDWSFSANTVEQIRGTIGQSDTADGVRIAMDGDRPAGYCWPRIQANARGETWGRISMIGVDPDYKGRGLGKQLLLSGLAYLKGRGLEVGRLTVDADNTVARSLYRSVGFTERDRSIWYEKVIDKGAG
jgi:mycothiol synthase